jgi:hypothetical protein
MKVVPILFLALIATLYGVFLWAMFKAYKSILPKKVACS